MKLLDDSAPRRSSRAPVWIGLAVVVLGGATGGYWLTRARPMPSPTAGAADAAPPTQAHAPRPTTKSGSVEVTSDQPDAVVFLDGQRLGPAPITRDDVPGGSHEVRIEVQGRPAIEREVNVIPGHPSRVEARFGSLPPRLHVTSDVAGASVFLDREFLGRTPLTVDVPAGSHALQISAEGLPPHSETIELTAGETAERHVLLQALPPLDASVAVEHKHGLGSCSGTLHATNDGLRYETDHKDAFSVPLDRLETFQIEYLDKTLTVKVRGGRKYNFRGEPDALFVFQKEVARRLPQ